MGSVLDTDAPNNLGGFSDSDLSDNPLTLPNTPAELLDLGVDELDPGNSLDPFNPKSLHTGLVSNGLVSGTIWHCLTWLVADSSAADKPKVGSITVAVASVLPCPPLGLIVDR